MSLVRRQRSLRQAGILALAFLAATQQLPAQAAPARTQRPATAVQAPVKATQVATVEGITEYTLPNGLRFLLFPDQSKPTVTVNVTYMVGSVHEGFGETGMAHLLEHMVFKGSKKHPQITQEFTKYGARRNGTTWWDRTNYYETVPATDENLQWALDMEADRMVNSFIAKKDLETEFSVVRNELESGENEMVRQMILRTARAAFNWHGYGRATIGTRSDIENVPIDRLQAFYRRYYQPDNAVLVVAGKFDPAKTLTLIEKTFGSIPRPKRSLEAGNLLYARYTVEPTQDGERVAIIRRVGDAQMVMAGYHTPAPAHPDFAAIDVLVEIMQSSPSGRLYKGLVDTKLAAQVLGGWFPTREPAIAIFGAMLTKQQSVDSARVALEKAIAEARNATFSSEEVDRAKTKLLTDIRLALNNSDQIGLQLSEWMVVGDWRMLFIHRDRLSKVTPADVQRVASSYLKPQNSTIAMWIPTAQPDRAEIPATPSVATLAAAYKGSEVVQTGEAFDASPANIDARTKRATLPSGMQLSLIPKTTRGNNVSARVVLRHGSEASLTGKGMVPVLTTAMLDRGTTALTRQQVQDSLAKLKAQVGIAGAGNNAIVSIQTTRPNLIPVLDLVGHVLRNPKFDAEELDKLKKERLATLEQIKSQPAAAAQFDLLKKLIPKPKGHPLYTSSVDEQIADVTAVTAEAVRAFYQSHYGATYADLAVVGDFDAAEVTAAATRLFGDWKSPQAFERLVRTYARTDSSFASFETPDKPNAVFVAGTTVQLKDDDPDFAAANMANFLFGGSGMSSRLVDRLRTKEGISYGAGSQLQVQQQDRFGIWIANAILAPQNVERVQRAFREEIDRVIKDGFTQQEFDQARTGLLLFRSQQRANDNELVDLLVARRFVGRTLTYDENLEKQIKALTIDQVNAALRKYIDPKRIIIVRAGDFAKNPPAKATP